MENSQNNIRGPKDLFNIDTWRSAVSAINGTHTAVSDAINRLNSTVGTSFDIKTLRNTLAQYSQSNPTLYNQIISDAKTIVSNPMHVSENFYRHAKGVLDANKASGLFNRSTVAQQQAASYSKSNQNLTSILPNDIPNKMYSIASHYNALVDQYNSTTDANAKETIAQQLRSDKANYNTLLTRIKGLQGTDRYQFLEAYSKSQAASPEDRRAALYELEQFSNNGYSKVQAQALANRDTITSSKALNTGARGQSVDLSKYNGIGSK